MAEGWVGFDLFSAVDLKGSICCWRWVWWQMEQKEKMETQWKRTSAGCLLVLLEAKGLSSQIWNFCFGWCYCSNLVISKALIPLPWQV